MIFPEPLVKPILRGTKTTHRRLCRLPRPSRKADGQPSWSNPWRPPVVGDSLAVQGTEQRIRILDVQRAELALPSDMEARAEGYDSPVAFAAAWMSEHDHRLRRVHREVDPDWLPPDDLLLEVFEQRQAGRTIWLLRFELDHDPVRLLIAEAGGFEPSAREDERGYTGSPAVALDAGDAVDDRVLDGFAFENQRRFETRRAQTRQEVAAERFERARRAAEARGLDVSGAVQVVERQAAALERAAGRVA